MKEVASFHQEDFDELLGVKDVAVRSRRILEDPHFRNQILNKKINGDHGENIAQLVFCGVLCGAAAVHTDRPPECCSFMKKTLT